MATYDFDKSTSSGLAIPVTLMLDKTTNRSVPRAIFTSIILLVIFWTPYYIGVTTYNYEAHTSEKYQLTKGQIAHDIISQTKIGDNFQIFSTKISELTALDSINDNQIRISIPKTIAWNGNEYMIAGKTYHITKKDNLITNITEDKKYSKSARPIPAPGFLTFYKLGLLSFAP